MCFAPAESEPIPAAAGSRVQPILQTQISTLLTTYFTVPEYITRV